LRAELFRASRKSASIGYLLWDLDHKVLDAFLPHLGSASVETRNAMGFRCLDNPDALVAGRPAPDALN
jgi:lactate dehydrogenase-like 2-hydroxyacid dehydrogenase